MDTLTAEGEAIPGTEDAHALQNADTGISELLIDDFNQRLSESITATAFRELDATDINSNSYEFNAPAPNDQEYKVHITFNKYARAVNLSEEPLTDVSEDIIESIERRTLEKLDRACSNVYTVEEVLANEDLSNPVLVGESTPLVDSSMVEGASFEEADSLYLVDSGSAGYHVTRQDLLTKTMYDAVGRDYYLQGWLRSEPVVIHEDKVWEITDY